VPLILKDLFLEEMEENEIDNQLTGVYIETGC